MTGVARLFFLSALVYSVLGVLLGNIMGATHDHSQMPTHAHIMVVGWVSFAVFGFFYHLFPSAGAGLMAKIHLVAAEFSLAVMIIALYIQYGGNPAIEPVLAISAMIFGATFVLFAFIASRAVLRPQ